MICPVGIRSFFGLDLASPEVDPDTVMTSTTFDVDVDSGVLYGVPSLNDWIYRTGRITRAEALRVPAVKRARDLIAGGIGQFPLRFLDKNGKVDGNFTPNLFQQPEQGVAPSVTWTRVVEDMLLFGQAWLKITNLGWHNFPIDFRRLDADTVTIQPQFISYPEGTATVWPETPGLIRIDSPNGGILAASAAVRACIALERAALNGVEGVPPNDYFTPLDGEDDRWETSEEVAEELLDPWAENRKKRSTAYIPAGLKYVIPEWDAQKLQLAEAREFAIKEVARLTGIDAEDLSVSTTSRTYFNAQDRRRVRIEDVQGTYMTAIEGRLSMPDVSPRGYTADVDTTSYLRLDDLTAAQSDAVLIAAKILTPEEARAKRGLDPAGAPTETPDPAAVAAAVAASIAIQTAQQGAPR